MNVLSSFYTYMFAVDPAIIVDDDEDNEEGTEDSYAIDYDAICYICSDNNVNSKDEDNTSKEKYYPQCKHNRNQYCMRCIAIYAKNHINEKRIRIKCPTPGCDKVFCNRFIKELVDETTYNEYMRDKQEFNQQRRDNSIVFKAKLWFITLWDNIKERIMLTRAIKNTRRCPSCAFVIEKNGGCDHMTCRKCSTEFHWCCGMLYSYSHSPLTCFLMRYGVAILSTTLLLASSASIRLYLVGLITTLVQGLAYPFQAIPGLVCSIIHASFYRVVLPTIRTFLCDTVLIFLGTILYSSSNRRGYDYYDRDRKVLDIGMTLALILVLRFVLPSSNFILTSIIMPIISITSWFAHIAAYVGSIFCHVACNTARLAILSAFYVGKGLYTLCSYPTLWLLGVIGNAITYTSGMVARMITWTLLQLQVPISYLLVVLQTVALTRIMRVFFGAFMFTYQDHNNDVVELERLKWNEGTNCIYTQYFEQCIVDDYNFDMEHLTNVNEQLSGYNRRSVKRNYNLYKIFDLDFLKFVFGITGPARRPTTSKSNLFMNIISSPYLNGVVALLMQLYFGASMIEMFTITYFVQHMVLLATYNQYDFAYIWSNYRDNPWIFSSSYNGYEFYTNNKGGYHHYGYALDKYRQLFVFMCYLLVIGYCMPLLIPLFSGIYSIAAPAILTCINLIMRNWKIISGFVVLLLGGYQVVKY